MFMLSFRLRRIPVLIGCAALALVIVFGVFGLRNVFAQNTTEAAFGNRQERHSNAARTNDERVKFLAFYGWEVQADPLEILEVIIPEKFDDVYEAYNDMQKSQGFDLSGNAGRRVKRYAYRITNYSGTDDPVRAHILVYRDRVIGGDVSSEIAGSFMHGFALPGTR
jgi:hypothetical protein